MKKPFNTSPFATAIIVPMPAVTPPRPKRRGVGLWPMLLIPTAIVLFILLQAWWWVFCRIEIEPDRVGLLIAKTGENLPSGEIIATESSQKGIQRDVLAEGRYFYNPIFWDWEIVNMLEIPANRLGVLVRLYGQDIPDEAIRAGQILASEGQKGITANVLQPGKYRINPYAEKVEIHKAMEIPAGHVGVVTNLTGSRAVRPNAFLVNEGEKGVSRNILTPGTYYLHPYMQQVNLMDCSSQRFELVGDDALKFPSSDAFEMTVLMTLEWAIDQSRAPEIFVRIGQMDDNPEKNEVLQKVIIPTIRGYGRIEGSKYSAIEYIAGNSRQIFQNTLFEKMKASCGPKGITIKSVLINDIEPPLEIAKPIREREIAKEELNRNKNQLKQAQAEQNLARSEELVKQETEKVKAKTTNMVRVIEAKNKQSVTLIDQDRRLLMEKTFLEASQKEAQATVSRGKAEADVILLNNSAEAEAFRKSVEAFKSPELYAYHEFLTRVAPAVTTIFANTEGAFGRIFSNLIPAHDEKKGGVQ
ncbi:MAG: SPFH domain-containing protein [Candidatus Ozemobacteraceae bacterium]